MLTTTVIYGNDGDGIDIGGGDIYDDVEKDIPFKSLRAIGLPRDKKLMTGNKRQLYGKR
jgi:hypothetical protein